MSGFEIVGVVLGGIPLVISALEHYREGVTIIHKWRRYQRERQILVSTLRTEKVKLENTCEALLHGLVPRSQIRAMIEDPFRAGHWKDAQVRRKLKARLDTAFESFEEIVNQMHCGMKEMMQRLDIHPDTVTYQSAETTSLREQIHRARFAISYSSYDDVIQVIRNGTADLDKLVEQSIRLEPERRDRVQVELLALRRETSLQLHHALANSISCACAHTFSLKLVTHSDNVMSFEDESDRLQRLGLDLLVGTGNKSRKGFQCYPMPRKKNPIGAGSKTSPPQSRDNPIALPSFAMQHSNLAATSISQVNQSVASTVAMSDLRKMDASGWRQIGNLCTDVLAIPSAPTHGCYGSIRDGHQQDALLFRLYPLELGNMDRSSPQLVSLGEIWEDKLLRPCMRYRAKLQLAVTIASSFLQLYKTPWLTEHVCADNILFVQSPATHLFDNMFIWKDINDHQPVMGNLSPILAARHNPGLLSLGFLLLEIFFGQPLEERRCESQVQVLESRYNAAEVWLKALEIQNPKYFSAVSRCLDGELHTAGYNAVDLQHNMYSGVVALLKDCLVAL